MRVADLPFLHFFIRTGDEHGSSLLSPSEAEETSGGSLFAPLQDDRELFPAYRFQFSVYLGDGTFAEDMRGEKVLFTGVAATESEKQRSRLTLIFGVPGPEPWKKSFPHFFPAAPRLLRHEDEFFIPILEKVPRRRPLSYRGRFAHPDFGRLFVELQPTAPPVLDHLLLHFGISLIGCDPHTKYNRRRRIATREQAN